MKNQNTEANETARPFPHLSVFLFFASFPSIRDVLNDDLAELYAIIIIDNL